MREIIFRGKRVVDGEWVVGLVVKDFEFYGQKDEHTYIVTHEHPSSCFGGDIYIEVIPSTVGQYTGLTDKNGTKIFEGDIIKIKFPNGARTTDFVRFANGGFLPFIIQYDTFDWGGEDCRVIGNIHDNPELLESEVEGE